MPPRSHDPTHSGRVGKRRAVRRRHCTPLCRQSRADANATATAPTAATDCRRQRLDDRQGTDTLGPLQRRGLHRCVPPASHLLGASRPLAFLWSRTTPALADAHSAPDHRACGQRRGMAGRCSSPHDDRRHGKTPHSTATGKGQTSGADFSRVGIQTGLLAGLAGSANLQTVRFPKEKR